MKLDNIEKLRNHVLDALEKMSSNKLTVEEVGIIAKSSETIMSSLKLQISYANLLNEVPNIEFLQKCHNSFGVIDGKDNVKKLTSK